MKKRRLVLGALLAIAVLVILIVGVGWEEVLETAQGTSLSIYGIAFLAVLGTLVCRTLAWNSILHAVDMGISRRRLFAIFCSATFLKYATPYGQLAASPGIAYVLSQYTDGRYESDFAVVVSGDFLNYLPYYTMGGVGFVYLVFWTDRGLDLGFSNALVAGFVLGTGALVLLFWYGRPLVEWGLVRLIGAVNVVLDWIARTKRRLLALRPGVSPEPAEPTSITETDVRDRLQGFYGTIDLFATDRRAVTAAIVYGHVGWLGLALAMYLTLYAMGSGIAFPLAMLTVSLSKIGFLIPAPGGLGGVEATIVVVLVVLVGLSSAPATAAAIMYRLAHYWFPFALGGLSTTALSMYVEPTDA